MQVLLDNDKAYIAFDTPEELDAKRKEIPNFQYDASTRMTMRNSLTMSKEEVDALVAEGKQYVVRFKIEPNEDVHVHDIIRGEVVINSSILDDKVLYKSADELPTYHWQISWMIINGSLSCYSWRGMVAFCSFTCIVISCFRLGRYDA